LSLKTTQNGNILQKSLLFSVFKAKFESMEKNDSPTKRPDSVELRYGQDQYEIGYSAGYKRCTWDARKRKATKEKCLKERFNSYVDYLEDQFAEMRKR